MPKFDSRKLVSEDAYGSARIQEFPEFLEFCAPWPAKKKNRGAEIFKNSRNSIGKVDALHFWWQTEQFSPTGDLCAAHRGNMGEMLVSAGSEGCITFCIYL